MERSSSLSFAFTNGLYFIFLKSFRALVSILTFKSAVKSRLFLIFINLTWPLRIFHALLYTDTLCRYGIGQVMTSDVILGPRSHLQHVFIGENTFILRVEESLNVIVIHVLCRSIMFKMSSFIREVPRPELWLLQAGLSKQVAGAVTLVPSTIEIEDCGRNVIKQVSLS